MLSDVDDVVAKASHEERRPSPDGGSHPSSQNVEATSGFPPAKESVTAGAPDNNAAGRPSGISAAAKWILGVGAVTGVLWLLHLGSGSNSVDRTTASAPTSTPAPASSSSRPPSLEDLGRMGTFDPTHAIAAINANVRSDPSTKAKVIRVVSRGENVQAIEETDSFLRVRLGDGTNGWIAKELAIPVAEVERLRGLSAQQYLEQRASEGRIEALFRQRDPQMNAFLIALYQIANRSPNTLATLTDLENAKAYTLVPDEAAAVWYGLSAKAAASIGNYEEASWNSRAAIEADPANPDYHIALALTSYEAGEYAVTMASAKIVPFLAPRTTNAWIVLGLAEALDEKEGLGSTATGAFVLAIRLSRNPAFTRKYLAELGVKTPIPRVRELTSAALAEEKENPSLFLPP